MARLPPSRHAVHRSLRIPDLRAGDDSPLRTCLHHVLTETYRSRRLPTQRLRHCGLNAISRTRSQPCADTSSSRSSQPCHDVHAVPLQSKETRGAEICDAVVLGRGQGTRLYVAGSSTLGYSAIHPDGAAFCGNEPKRNTVPSCGNEPKEGRTARHVPFLARP